jgi:hypothetical protein
MERIQFVTIKIIDNIFYYITLHLNKKDLE